MQEDHSQNPETNFFKKETIVKPFNTESLVYAYGESFEEIVFLDGFSFFTEKPTSDNSNRGYRYIASKVKTPNLDEQNLYTIQMVNPWDVTLAPEDYLKIDDAGEDIKKQMEDKDMRGPLRERTVILKNGRTARVEYIPYTLESSKVLMNDLG